MTAPRGWRLMLLLGAAVAITPMSIDMYLPSFPAMQADFGTDAAAVQATLSAYFIGLAFGQLIYGPVADRIGRRKPLLFGLALYTLASIGCFVAPDIEALTALRLLQALGGCAGSVICRAIVRDLYQPQEMAQVTSTLMLVIGVAPILAPTMGGMLHEAFGWRAVFAVMVLYGAAVLAAVLRFLPDTRPPDIKPARGNVFHGYFHLLKHRRFMGYALAGSVAQAGMFAYIAASSFVFVEIYGLSPKVFGWVFGANAAGLILATQVNTWLLKRHRTERVLKGALTSFLCFALLLVAAAASGFGGIWGLLVPLFGCISSLGFSFPNSNSAAMVPFGDRAGMASALLGTIQFGIGGLATLVMGHLHDGTALPMTLMILGCALVARGLLHFVVGRRFASD